MSDPCSFSSFTRCVTKHLNLHLHLDFDRHVIRGRVALTVEALEDRFSTLVTSTGRGGVSLDLTEPLVLTRVQLKSAGFKGSACLEASTKK